MEINKIDYQEAIKETLSYYSEDDKIKIEGVLNNFLDICSNKIQGANQ